MFLVDGKTLIRNVPTVQEITMRTSAYIQLQRWEMGMITNTPYKVYSTVHSNMVNYPTGVSVTGSSVSSWSLQLIL